MLSKGEWWGISDLRPQQPNSGTRGLQVREIGLCHLAAAAVEPVAVVVLALDLVLAAAAAVAAVVVAFVPLLVFVVFGCDSKARKREQRLALE